MEEDYALAALYSDDPIQLLKGLCEEQGKTTLALKQLEKTQSELLGPSESPDGSGDTGSAFGTTADVAGILAAVDAFSGQMLSKPIQSVVVSALELATKNPVAAGILAIIAASIGAIALLNYEMEQGWIERPNMEQMTETMNTVGDIYGASNPFLYQEDETPKRSDYTPEERGEMARQNYEKRKKARDNIAQATATLNTIGDIYGASNPFLYQPTATFNARQDSQTQPAAAYDGWQDSQTQPAATYDGWQRQQTQLAETQTQITQYLQTQTDNRKDQAVTLNVTNNFKGVTQDRRSLNDIGEYLARQIVDDLNSCKQLYSNNW